MFLFYQKTIGNLINIFALVALGNLGKTFKLSVYMYICF